MRKGPGSVFDNWNISVLIWDTDIGVITKSPNSEQSYKSYSQQPENCENCNDPDLVQAFLKKWWVESNFKALNLPKLIHLHAVF